MDPKLFEAAVSGDVDFLRRNANHDLNQQTPENSAALHDAITFRRPKFARELIQFNPSLIQHAKTYGDTPLHIAAKVGSSEIVELLITVADLENGEVGLCLRTNLVEDTALHIAVRYGHLDVVKLLMRRHPVLSGFSNNANETPIFIAIEGGFMKIASEILLISPSPPCGGRNGMTALHAAVIHTKPGRSAKDYVSIDPITLYYRTTFPSGLCLDYNKYFQSSHQIDIVRELAEKYPTMIKETDIQGWTALHYAAHIGHIEAIKLLMDHDSSLAYLKTNEGMSALHIAAMAGHVDVTREIIRRRPDACYVLDNVRQTFLHVAVKHTRSAVVAYIVKNWKLEGVLNVGDENGNTPLHLAAISGLNLAAISVWYLAAIYWFRFSQQYKILKSLARDIRVDKKIMNNQHLTAIDIIIANEQTSNSTKNMIIKAMKQGGSRQNYCIL